MKTPITRSQAFESMDAALSGHLFGQRENNFVHATLNEELSGFEPVLEGDINTLKRTLPKHRTRVFPKLSDSPLQQRKFLFVSSITTCCRLCIEHGMPSDESYGLSDLYIQRVDKCTSVDEIHDLYETMMLDYATRMRKYKTGNEQLSPKVIEAINYIESHLHDRITVKNLADELEMNASWLSTVFAKEVGMPLSEYICRKKIAAAGYLLSYYDYSCSEIAEYLGFSSESHFSARFSQYEGVTPKEYRRQHFRKVISNINTQ